MAERSRRIQLVTMLLTGVMIGLMLTGTAWAVTYLTRPQAAKLFLENTHVYIKEGTVPGGAGNWHEDTIECPNGTQAVGGGVDMTSGAADVRIVASAPTLGAGHQHPAQQGTGRHGRANGWYVRIVNQIAGAHTYSLAVSCSK